MTLRPRTTTAWVYSKTRLLSSFLLALGLTTFAGCPTASVINRGKGWCCSKVWMNGWVDGWMDGLKINVKFHVQTKRIKCHGNQPTSNQTKSRHHIEHLSSHTQTPDQEQHTQNPVPEISAYSSSQQPAPNKFKMSSLLKKEN